MPNSLLFRSLLIYAICLPLAIFLGSQLATWDESFSFYSVVAVLAMMLIPMLLRWHHVWLIAAWNMPVVLFFLKGRPSLLWLLIGASLLISVLQHTLNRERQFTYVRSLVMPLLFLTGVALVTAKLTGGIGLNVAGSANVGGKRYLNMFFAIAGYFALTANQIPAKKVRLYVAIFFLGATAMVISDMAYFAPQRIGFIIPLLFVPPDILWEPVNNFLGGTPELARLGGVAGASLAIATTLLAIYGVAGIFDGRKLWRAVLFLAFAFVSMFGGFRSLLIGLVLTAGLVFWLEGSMRTRLMPIILFICVLGTAIMIPFTDKLPLSIQRTISFVPFIKIDQFAAAAAQGSTDWRLEIWRQVIPEVPKYLLVGKGYSMNAAELNSLTDQSGIQTTEGTIMSGDYHNGPLSVIIPFGIAGAAGFLWFLGAGIRVLYYNYRYGDPAFQRINTYLFASFLAKTIFFFVIFGSLHSDLAIFAGLLGLSVSINGGMRQPVAAPAKHAPSPIRLVPVRAHAVR